MKDDADTILDRLTKLYPKAIEPGLERTLRILDDLGNPQDRLPPVIHIAGTNGKGSTLAFIRSILESWDYKAHIMTSPHLVKFNERLVIASKIISDSELENLLSHVEKINGEKPVTFFEITTAAGLFAFAEAQADYCLLETGMGGRLDSTNVVARPALTIITNISYDHMQHLGNNLQQIAFEKAGIMKQGVPCVIGPLSPDAMNENVMSVFERRAHELNAPLYRHGYEWNFMQTTSGFDLTFCGKKYSFPLPGLLGDHQIANAATAIVSLLCLKEFKDKNAQEFSGITKAQWPARLQKITAGPLFEMLPKDWELFLDGGHNEAGGQILADQARHWADQDGKQLHLILGMLTTKDPKPFFAHLKPYISSATAIGIEDEKLAFKAEDLGKELNIVFSNNIPETIGALANSNSKGRILIAGSLYLAGNIISQYKL